MKTLKASIDLFQVNYYCTIHAGMESLYKVYKHVFNNLNLI